MAGAIGNSRTNGNQARNYIDDAMVVATDSGQGFRSSSRQLDVNLTKT
jgi:hypothetical protein